MKLSQHAVEPERFFQRWLCNHRKKIEATPRLAAQLSAIEAVVAAAPSRPDAPLQSGGATAAAAEERREDQAAAVSNAVSGRRPQKRRAVPSGAGSAATSCADHGASVSASFPGINIRWPFSQLILAGAKTVEVREYMLGHRNIAHADQELWLIETPGGPRWGNRATGRAW